MLQFYKYNSRKQNQIPSIPGQRKKWDEATNRKLN